MSEASRKAAREKADRSCKRLKVMLRLLREKAVLTPYALEMATGVPRDSVPDIEDLDSKTLPGFHVALRWVDGCGWKLWRVLRLVEEGPPPKKGSRKKRASRPSETPD